MEEKDEIVISLSDVWNIIKKNAAFIIVSYAYLCYRKLFYNKIFYSKVIHVFNSVIC